MSFKITAIALAGLVAVNLAAAQTAAPAAPEAAKAPEPDYTIAYNIGAVSDYRFRGISQTSGGPAVQGGIDFTAKNGIYLGTWASNVKWIKDFNGATNGSVELDLYGGYRGEIAKDLTYDVGVIGYTYPSNNSGAAGTPGAGMYSSANTTEYYGGLTYKIYTLKYNRSAGNFLGNLNSNGSSYIDFTAAIDLGNGYSLSPDIGRQTIVNSPAGNYTEYSLTLGKDLGNGVSLSAAIMGTSAKNPGFYNSGFRTDFKYIANSTAVIGAKYSF